jgi:glutamyl-tRNA synthetase
MSMPRVRFAPAPSGWLHVGGARTALFNWLHARGGGGAFVLRIEDTDAERTTDAAFAGLLEALDFLGLEADEGPQVGGAYGPYRQSERGSLYGAVASALLAAGHAYEAFETPEELEAERQAAQDAGEAPGYRGGHRELTDEQRAAYRAEGRDPVLRLRTPDEGSAAHHDLVRGPVEFAWAGVTDFVIQRADGSPTYFLANTVDDLAMGITLVARGEDLLSATPRQVLLAELLTRDGLLEAALADGGYPSRPADAELPAYAHLPLLVGEDRKPLSKRHGAVAVDEFRRAGYLPEGLANFLALCGWSYDATTEHFSVAELVTRFSFDRVGKAPALFDTDKLRALNGEHVKALDDAELAERLRPYFVEAGLLADPPTGEQLRLLAELAPLLRERVQTLAEAPPLVDFCFRNEIGYDDKAVAKHLKGKAGEVLAAAEAELAELDGWSGETIMAVLDDIASRLELGRGKTFQPVRVAVAGNAVSPPLPETLAVMERETVLTRIGRARQLMSE